MFDSDKWQEIFQTIRKNKLRTILTAVGVWWGIFMLVLMMGAGNGLENGVMTTLDGYATNSFFVWSQRTTIPHKGMKPGRRVQFTTEDIGPLRAQVPAIEHLCPRNALGGYNGGNNVTRGKKVGNFNVYGDYPEMALLQPPIFTSGRFLNHKDMVDRRKVAVIGDRVREILFEPGEEPVGQYIKIQGIYFQVIGVFKSQKNEQEADRDNQTIHVPHTTFLQAFNFANRISWFAMSAKPGHKASEVETKVKAVLGSLHRVHPDDEAAFGSSNLEERFQDMVVVFTGIRLIVWIVGIGTLFAGIVGVSNIMLIIVRERTREIGIRKAMGATPGSIISQILQESVFLTTLAGYTGLLTGILLLEGVSIGLAGAGGGAGFFSNPGIDFGIAISAMLVLIISGALAGLIPALRAARINPIVALRAE